MTKQTIDSNNRFSVSFARKEYLAQFVRDGKEWRVNCLVGPDTTELEYFRNRHPNENLPFNDYYLVAWALKVLGSHTVKTTSSYSQHYIPINGGSGRPTTVDESYDMTPHNRPGRRVLSELKPGQALQFSDGTVESFLERREDGGFYIEPSSIPTPLAISLAETVLADEIGLSGSLQMCLAGLQPEHEGRIVTFSRSLSEVSVSREAPELSAYTRIGLFLVNLRAALELGQLELPEELRESEGLLTVNAIRPLLETSIRQLESLGIDLPPVLSQTDLLERERLVEERTEAVEGREAAVGERETALESGKKAAIEDLDSFFRARFEELSTSAAALTRRSLDQREKELEERQRSLDDAEASVLAEMEEAEKMRVEVAGREEALAAREAALEKTKAEILRLQRGISN